MRIELSIFMLLGLIVLTPKHGVAEVDPLWTHAYRYTTSSASWNSIGGPSVEQTLDGGFIVATGVDSLQVVKTDALGGILWTSSFDLSAHYWHGAIGIQQLDDGGYVLCGGEFFEWPGTGGFLMRLDAEGDSLWIRRHFISHNTSVQQTADGGLIMAGYIQNGSFAWGTLTKTGGDVEWECPMWGYPAEGLNHVVVLRDGSGYAAVGWHYTDGVAFVKTDLDGNQVASGTYGDYWSRGAEILETQDGGFIMCGESGNDDAYLIRTDAIGDTLWTKRYDSWRSAQSVVETSQGTFLAVGGEGGQTWILETDAAGDALWSRSFDNFPYDEYARRIRSTSDGGYIIAGGGRSHPDHPYSLFLMRAAESVSDVPSPVAAASSYVHLQPNVPNPFHPTTRISYSISEPGDVHLRVFDPMGRLVRTLVHGPRPAGTHRTLWDGTKQAGTMAASGVYFYQLMANGETLTRRMTLAR